MMKFAKMLVRIFLGAIALGAFGLISPLLLVISLLAMAHDKYLLGSG